MGSNFLLIYIICLCIQKQNYSVSVWIHTFYIYMYIHTRDRNIFARILLEFNIGFLFRGVGRDLFYCS